MAAAEDRAARPRMTADEFCEAYYDRVVGFAVHAFGGDDAVDVAHDAMSRVLAAYDSLDPERDAWPWLATVVRNAGRETLRRRACLPIEEAESVAAPDGAFDAAAAAEERRTLARALRHVPEADRDVLLMRVRDELPFAEIAARTGRSPGALRVQALRARQRLAKEFARLGGTAYGIGALVAARAGRLRERAAGLAAVLPPAAQVAVAAVICGGMAVGTPAGAGPAVTAAAPPAAVTSAVAARPARLAVRAPRVAGSRPTAAVVRGVTYAPPPAAAPAPDYVPWRAGAQEQRIEVPVGDRTIRLERDGQGGSGHPLCELPAALC